MATYCHQGCSQSGKSLAEFYKFKNFGRAKDPSGNKLYISHHIFSSYFRDSPSQNLQNSWLFLQFCSAESQKSKPKLSANMYNLFPDGSLSKFLWKKEIGIFPKSQIQIAQNSPLDHCQNGFRFPKHNLMFKLGKFFQLSIARNERMES